ncbi:MAG: gephyrin-like molybdotransferase Glp [Pseudomonadota bacterium]
MCGVKPPPLKHDCFALPPGVHWTPVEEALARLAERLDALTEVESCLVTQAAGRYLAEDVFARSAHPPAANSAVDGYALGAGLEPGLHHLPLTPGRAAAGAPYPTALARGYALRILTGAPLPAGATTVVLEEDVVRAGGEIALNGPVAPGANVRSAGEDVAKGAHLLSAQRQLTAADLALLTATGHSQVRLHRRLRVAVLSTGDELAEPSPRVEAGMIFDANRPMLLSILARWGFEAIDLGRVGDDREKVSAALDHGARRADAILTTGGASAGDEDHISALLNDRGAMATWRVAIKPGRPLALGIWEGTPVFGLPGNPVAAFVCTLVFGWPALRQLAGGSFEMPQSFSVPAGFTKRKKEGRTEYLRARIRDGRAEVFASEGSGRISGLSWAEGLVKLDPPACEIAPGDLVSYIPFGSFGL